MKKIASPATADVVTPAGASSAASAATPSRTERPPSKGMQVSEQAYPSVDLEGYVREAFAKAASAHFPDSLIRPDLHEAAQVSGAWLPLPAATRHKHYKKYSRVLEITITPQMAAALKSFGGVPVQTILRDQQGVFAGRAIAARVHLYEAVPGATLPDIAFHEKNVRGLGSSRREAMSYARKPVPPNSKSKSVTFPVASSTRRFAARKSPWQ